MKASYCPSINTRAYSPELLMRRLRVLLDQRQAPGSRPTRERWLETQAIANALRSYAPASRLLAQVAALGPETQQHREYALTAA